MYTKEFYNKNLKFTARELRNKATFAEKKIWQQFLKTIIPKAHRQRSLGRFIVDFYIPKAKLVIEIDGDVHEDIKSQAKDRDRTNILSNSGILVIRFKNEQILNDFSSVCKTIQEQISLRT